MHCDDSPSGSRIRHLALSINSFSLNDPRVQKILSFTKLGNMTDEDVLDMVNDIRKVNGKPEIYNVTEDEIMLEVVEKLVEKDAKQKERKAEAYEGQNRPNIWRRHRDADENEPAGSTNSYESVNPFTKCACCWPRRTC